MILIGLTGLAQSGKDTVADYLVSRHGFEKKSFADPLKQVLRSMDPVLGNDITAPGFLITVTQALERFGETAVKNTYPRYRKYLQKLGTEGIRKIDPDFWIKAAEQTLEESGRYVFTDIRFPNEADFIGGRRGSLWQVERDLAAKQTDKHVSETWAGKLHEDFLIYNNGSMDKLYNEIEYALSRTEWQRLALWKAFA